MQSSLNRGRFSPGTQAFHYRVFLTLNEFKLPFLVGGDCAVDYYTGITPRIQNLDFFVRPDDCQRVLVMLSTIGYPTELSALDWRGRAFSGEHSVNIIFNSPDRRVEVDETWFEHAVEAEILDIPVKFCSPEDLIWSKASNHSIDPLEVLAVGDLLDACSERLDWSRLLHRFGCQWRMLFGHLILFCFVCPTGRRRVPDWVLQALSHQFDAESEEDWKPFYGA